jgi:TetR/AcrR family transcriptional repressor of lmrAB and yxaGH operons
VPERVRDRMIVGAAELLARAGVAEASFSNVLAHTGAPRGSIYHHFPGGKDELIAESMRYVGGRLLTALRSTQVGSPEDVVVVFAGLFRRMLVDSGAVAGCAVAAVTVDSGAATAGGTAAAEVFRSWRRELERLFAQAGQDPVRAPALAALTLAAVEGALVLARAESDVGAFDSVVDQLVSAVRAPVAQPG